MGLTVKIKTRLTAKVESSQEGMLSILSVLSTIITHKGTIDDIKINPTLDLVECLTETYANNVSAKELLFPELMSLLSKEAVSMEIWTSCGEIGYDEHLYVKNGSVVVEEDMQMPSPEDVDNGAEEREEQKTWNKRWGTWIEEDTTSNEIDDCNEDVPF